MTIIKDLYYTKDHEWVRVEGNNAYIGITDFAQHAMGDIVYVELPEIDADIVAGDSFSVVESVKAAADIYAPLSGRVVEVAEALVDSPQLLNSNPYEHFIAVVEDFDDEALSTLMDATAYEIYCSSKA